MAGASSRPVAESVVAWSNPGRSTSAPSYDHLFSNPAPAPVPAPASPIGSLFGSFSADAGARAKPTPSSPLIWELLCVETSASHGLVGVKSTGSKSGECPPPSHTVTPPFSCYDLDFLLGFFGFNPFLMWFCWQIPMHRALLTVEGSLLKDNVHKVSQIDPLLLFFQHVLCDFCS